MSLFFASPEVRRCKLLTLCQKIHCPKALRGCVGKSLDEAQSDVLSQIIQVFLSGNSCLEWQSIHGREKITLSAILWLFKLQNSHAGKTKIHRSELFEWLS